MQEQQPVNCFLLYCRDNRADLQLKHPELSNATITSMLGKRWRELDTKQKAKYVTKAKQLKQVSCLSIHFQRNFFTNEDIFQSFAEKNPNFSRKKKHPDVCAFTSSFKVEALPKSPISKPKHRVPALQSKQTPSNPPTPAIKWNFQPVQYDLDKYSSPCPYGDFNNVVHEPNYNYNYVPQTSLLSEVTESPFQILDNELLELLGL